MGSEGNILTFYFFRLAGVNVAGTGVNVAVGVSVYQYSKFNAILKYQNLKFFSNFEDKLIVIIIMQLKFEHEYFQLFQKILIK